MPGACTAVPDIVTVLSGLASRARDVIIPVIPASCYPLPTDLITIADIDAGEAVSIGVICSIGADPDPVVFFIAVPARSSLTVGILILGLATDAIDLGSGFVQLGAGLLGRSSHTGACLGGLLLTLTLNLF